MFLRLRYFARYVFTANEKLKSVALLRLFHLSLSNSEQRVHGHGPWTRNVRSVETVHHLQCEVELVSGDLLAVEAEHI